MEGDIVGLQSLASAKSVSPKGTVTGTLANGDTITCGDISSSMEIEALRIGGESTAICELEKAKRSVKAKNGTPYGAGAPDFEVWWESIGIGGRFKVRQLYGRANFGTEAENSAFLASITAA